MSVSIFYQGRLGNNLFQYACARMFAIDNGLWLETPLVENNIVKSTPHEEGERRSGPTIALGDNDGLFQKRYEPGRYDLRGFCQNGNWFFPREKLIKSFLHVAPIGTKNTKDIVLHCRLTDYKWFGWIIHPEWYVSILKLEKFERLYIVTDEISHPFLSAFNEFHPHIICSTPESDWQFLRSFDRMIISMSTFAWWAAFFSEASRVYVFQRYQFGLDLNRFPNAVVVDGPLLHEKPGFKI